MNEHDPERPRRLLDEVLARREFGGEVTSSPDWLSRWLDRAGEAWSGFPDWTSMVVTGVLVLGALALILFLLLEGGVGRRRRAGAALDVETEGGTARRQSAREILRLGIAAHRAGRNTEATLLLFRGILGGLIERGLLLADPSRTNREHLRDLRTRSSERQTLAAVIPIFERVCYGHREAAAEEVGQLAAAGEKLMPELWHAAERELQRAVEA